MTLNLRDSGLRPVDAEHGLVVALDGQPRDLPGLGPVARRCTDRLGDPQVVVRQQGGRRLDHLGRAPVVDLEQEARSSGEVVLVVDEEPRARAGVAVDDLVVVAERQRSGDGAADGALIVIARESDVERAARAGRAAFDEKRGGLGLSLPIARRIVERHGGEIWACSDGRTGAQFMFTLGEQT